MFYKLMSNDIVMDLLREVSYVRYLPKAQRWVITDPQSAHGVMGSDHDKIFYIEGRKCACKEKYPRVIVKEISEQEYNNLATHFFAQQEENAELKERMANLELKMAQQTDLLAEQNALLTSLLLKLN